MFAHKQLEWSLVYQSPEQSETEWLCVDVAGYKIITSTNLHTRDSYQRLSRRSHTPVCTLVTSTANMSTGATTIHLMTVRALTPGQRPTTLDCCMTQRKQPVFSLTDGTSAPGPGLREFQPGQQIAGQTCSRKVPTVTPSALHHNANKTQDSSDPVISVSLKLKKAALSALFLVPADKNFENWHLQGWTQFRSQEKISQTIISLFFQWCAGHFHDLSRT